MRTQKKFLPFLYAFLLSLLPIVITFFFISPETKLAVAGVNLGTPLFMLAFIFTSSFLLFTFVFASKRRGILAATFITGIFVLRLFGLKGIFHTIVLLIIILLIEYLYSKRSPHEHKKIV